MFESTEIQEFELTQLLDKFHNIGLSTMSYSRMLRLAKVVGRRHGLSIDDVITGQY